MGTRNRRANNAAFGASPQGFGPDDPLRTPQIGQVTGQERPKTPPVWPYRDHGPRPRPGSHANVRRRAKVTQSWALVTWIVACCPRLHRLVVRTAAALRGNPGDVAVGVLYVAGFAVDAVLGVDLEARARTFLDPLIDAGRTITTRGTGKHVVLGGLLEVHVRDLEMNRLVLLMIGIGQEHRRELVEGNLAVRLRVGPGRVGLGRIERRAIGLRVRLGAEQ